jgi:hypothetical protein
MAVLSPPKHSPSPLPGSEPEHVANARPEECVARIRDWDRPDDDLEGDCAYAKRGARAETKREREDRIEALMNANPVHATLVQL